MPPILPDGIAKERILLPCYEQIGFSPFNEKPLVEPERQTDLEVLAVRFGMLVGLITMLALASGQKVEFPIGYYSYEEIAKRMSTADAPVACSPELRHAIVLLHLKPREWQQTRKILENTLDIQFRSAGDGANRWVITRHPEQQKLDQRLRKALASHIEQHLQTERLLGQKVRQANTTAEQIIKESASRLLAKTLSDYPELVQHQRLMLSDLIALFREAPFQGLLANWRNIRRFQGALAKGFPRVIIPRKLSPQQADPADQQADPDFGDEQSLGHHQQWTSAQQLAVERFLASYSLQSFGLHPALLRLAERHSQLTQPEWSERYGRVWFEAPSHRMVWALSSLCGLLHDHMRGYVRDTIVQRLHPPLSILQAIEQGVLAQVYELDIDTELLALWLDDVEGKLIPLNAPPTTRIRMLATAQWRGTVSGYGLNLQYFLPHFESPHIGWKSFSDYVSFSPSHDKLLRLFGMAAPSLQEKFRQALQRHESLLKEPVLSQFPPRSEEGSSTIYERLYEWAQQRNQEIAVELVLSWDTTLSGWGTSWRFFVDNRTPIQEALQKRTEYAETLLDRYETVWTLRNFAAFISRSQRLPATAIRRLILSAGDSADWKSFYQSLTPMQAAILATGAQYIPPWLRNGQRLLIDADIVSAYGEAWLILHILEQLPESEREQLLKEPKWATVIKVPLGQLPSRAKARIADVLSIWAMVQLASESLPDPFRRQNQAWFDLLVGRLSTEQFLNGLVLVRGDRSWALRYHAPDPSLPDGIELIYNGLPRIGKLIWTPN